MTHQTSLNGPYHATWLQDYVLCPKRALYDVMYPPEFTTLAQFKGSVVHRMLFEHTGDYNMALQHCEAKLDAPLIEDAGVEFHEECLELFTAAANNMPHHYRRLAEHEFVADIGGYQFDGAIDAIWDMPNGETWLVDYKTSKTLPSQLYLDMSLQFSIYAFAMRQHGVHIDRIAWIHIRDWLPYLKATSKASWNRTDSLQEWADDQKFQLNKAGNEVLPAGSMRGPGVHLTQRNDMQLDETELEIKRIIRGIKFKIFPRGGYNNIICDRICGSCGHRTRCIADLQGVTNIKVSKTQQTLSNEMEYDNE